ncbi:MAG: hypothetical protein BGO87_08435 [Flavobacteriia bacterium 40-80]|nr:MAG: hypothetical protein BGO87_08435 [Flavobacteriia bacterium 40-80]
MNYKVKYQIIWSLNGYWNPAVRFDNHIRIDGEVINGSNILGRSGKVTNPTIFELFMIIMNDESLKP